MSLCFTPHRPHSASAVCSCASRESIVQAWQPHREEAPHANARANRGVACACVLVWRSDGRVSPTFLPLGSAGVALSAPGLGVWGLGLGVGLSQLCGNEFHGASCPPTCPRASCTSSVPRARVIRKYFPSQHSFKPFPNPKGREKTSGDRERGGRRRQMTAGSPGQLRLRPLAIGRLIERERERERERECLCVVC